jgi:hypothetical protein
MISKHISFCVQPEDVYFPRLLHVPVQKGGVSMRDYSSYLARIHICRLFIIHLLPMRYFLFMFSLRDPITKRRTSTAAVMLNLRRKEMTSWLSD